MNHVPHLYSRVKDINTSVKMIVTCKFCFVCGFIGRRLNLFRNIDTLPSNSFSAKKLFTSSTFEIITFLGKVIV